MLKPDDRMNLSTWTRRLKHGTGWLEGPRARLGFSETVERLLDDHARLRAIVGEGPTDERDELVAAALDMAEQFERGKHDWDYTRACGRLRRAAKKVRALPR